MKFSRRDFLKSSALFLTAAALSPKQIFSSDNPAAQKRALQMLVLGDSIVWGQGLLEEEKFWFLTKKWLETETKRAVIEHVEAHSGATIIWHGDQKYPKDRLNTFNGELNISTPTIMRQVQKALKHYESKGIARQDVDLVLVDGGINDLGIFNLVNPLRSEKWLRRRTQKIFRKDMPKLLESIYAAFPQARIVVTGYYPVISAHTEQKQLCPLLNILLNDVIINRFLNSTGLGRLFKLLRIRVGRVDVCSFEWVKEQINDLIMLSAAWRDQSDKDLRQTIEDFNRLHPMTAADGDNGRAIFVPSPIGSENAYAARDTDLWEITEGGDVFGRYKSNDKFYAMRREMVCDCAHLRLEGFDLDQCFIAGTGHPSDKGARKYAAAIQKQLGEVLPQTDWVN